MTSEVVIMNKLGMALAADSAITSGRDGVQKVYHSANKLFSLSKNHPVGLMVYGAASFMEVPWDVIIKTYRDHLGDKTFAEVSYYVEDLLDFLRQDERFRKESLEEIIIYRTFSDLLKDIIRDVEDELYQAEENGPEDDTVTRLLTRHIENQISAFKQKKEEFIDIDYEAFKSRFHTIIQEIKEEVIVYDVPVELDERLSILAYEAIKKDYFSVGSTGLVVAGYGEDAIFPHLVNIRLEGFVFGQLKYKKIKEKKISYSPGIESGTAVIVPFAQREMVDSFMYGIEPLMEETIFGIFEKVLERYHEQIEKNLDIAFTEKQVNDLKKVGNEVYESMKDAVYEYQQGNYIEPLLGVVRSLPKEELADMAEALINLTSFKQRVTRAAESVGPPIDVAVITKGDGFIWMKRKNTIDQALNAQF